MPTPVASNPTSTPQVSPHPTHRPQPNASRLQNGINGEGAVQQPNAPTGVDGLDVAPDENDIIRQGKEKAKAVMAASGVKLDPDIPEISTSRTDMAFAPPRDTVINGVSPSRKRSRSGSPKPSQSSAQDLSEVEEKSAQEREAYERTQYLYTTRDLQSAANLNDRYEYSQRVFAELKDRSKYNRDVIGTLRQKDPGAIFGYGYMGYGNGTTNIRGSSLQYPMHSKRPGNRRSKTIGIKKKDGEAQAEQVEELIPVRLDIELDKIKLRDTFTWNLHDRVINPEIFAEYLVEDFKLPLEIRGHLIQLINREIQEQIQDYYPHAFFDDEPLDPHLPYSAFKNDEMRVLIKLNITIGQHTLVDQFEWEINNPLNSPEEFARQMSADLSLSGEFTTAIAHSIREQCQMFTKSLYITGHPFDGRPVEDADIRDNLLQSPLPSVFRPMQSAKDYTPYLYELSEVELERAELSILREQRRQKRSVNRRGGPALPDLKDKQRTVRTLLVSSVLPGAAETIEESHLFKVSRKPKPGGRPGRNDDDSEDSDSEDSAPDSPAPSQLTGGTARTRGMRGAATAAQAAMRSAIGRSATPEVSSLQAHHETRTTRQLRYESRDESVPEPTTLIVKLRISSKKFREYLQNPKAFTKPASTPHTTPSALPARGTPGLNSMPPPPSPAMQPRSTPGVVPAPVESSPRTPTIPTSSGKQWTYYNDGRTDAPWPMAPGTQHAPPPPWLQKALQDLQKEYPSDLFESLMRYSVLDQKTLQSIKMDTLSASAALPQGYKAQYLPRIRCNDCPGKLYTAGPEHTVANFEVHLKNRQHKTNVEKRTGKTST
ncbi:SNF5-domain-containing protein [Pleomassaria siparia CBS 279.74]|uniref:SNF5-domain-containing protein n=1 Tax=Pleomassaria siparia CBS 279.74 TaxID=1314801 RepID=A0A6G1KH51_9PLEO|nr:SNF5-domain-containing protein [Pleomassaria siparia CBS 279.74]